MFAFLMFAGMGETEYLAADNPKSCLGQVFNFKLVSFASQCKIYLSIKDFLARQTRVPSRLGYCQVKQGSTTKPLPLLGCIFVLVRMAETFKFKKSDRIVIKLLRFIYKLIIHF